MTATPIPRTLALTVYGDMDVSKLTEKPPGRQPVDTRVLPMARMDEVVEGLRRCIAKGGRAYWVCPLVERKRAGRSCCSRRTACKLLPNSFPGKVGLVHGRLKGAEKDEVMAAFKSGALSVSGFNHRHRSGRRCARSQPSW